MAVALGSNFLVAVNQFGVVLTCGQNDAGQLGLGLTPDVDTDTKQRILLGATEYEGEIHQRNAVMVSAGKKHAAFVTRSGSVYTWGGGADGQLGVGAAGRHVLRHPIPRLAFSTRTGGSRATMVACGNEHTLLLTASGHVWGCGSNVCFQIGVQNMDDLLRVTNSCIPVFTMMPSARFDCGDGDTQIGFIAAGFDHSVAVGRANGLLWTWGRGTGGKLGHGDGGMRHYAHVPTHLPQETFGEAVVSASVSDEITMAITGSGALWVCGYSYSGSLGLGNVQQCVTFQCVGIADDFGVGGVRIVACSLMHSLIVSHDGSVRVCGRDAQFNNDTVPTLIDPAYFNNEAVVLVSASESRSVAVTASGRLYTWGAESANEFCGLGYTHESAIGTALRQMSPRQVLYTNIPYRQIDLFGLWHFALSEDEMLAFAMGMHRRLGRAARFQTVSDDVLRCIRGSGILPGASHFGVGLRNLLGI